MATNRGHLRSRLDLLLSGRTTTPTRDPTTLPIDHIRAGQYQPRTRFDEIRIRELAESIAQHGLLQPILIRPIAQGNFELIAGERRFRAAKLAGLVDVPCVIRDASDDEALALALIENIQREDLSTIEEARALRRLVDEFSLSHAEAGKAVGRSRAAVSNLMRLLELAEPVQALLEEGLLEMGHARALLAVPPTKQFEAAEMVVTKDLTVRQTERLVRSLSHGTQSLDSPTGAIVPLVHSRWKLRLNIRRTKDGLATVTLRGLSQEELGSLLEYLRKG